MSMTLTDIAKFLELIDHSHQKAFWLTSKDFSKTFFVGKAYESIWGHNRNKLYKKPMAWLDTIELDEHQNSPLDNMKSILEQQKHQARFDEHYRIRRTDKNDVVFIRDTGHPIFQDNQIIGILRQIENISIKHTPEEDIKNLIGHADQTKELFTNNMRHLFRTPMAVIIGLSDQIYNLTSNPAIQEHSIGIRQSCESLLKSFNDILEISEINHGIEKKIQPYSWISIIKELDLQFQPLYQEKDLSFIIDFDKDKSPDSVGCGYLNKKILEKIIHNAIKNTDSGSITLSIQYQVADCHWLIKVQDTGRGMTPQEQVSIYELFESVLPSYRNRDSGLGLGLYMTKQHLEKLDGTIKVSSEINQGTCFTLTIPNHSAITYQDINHDTLLSKQKVSSVLVIEDDVITSKVMNLSFKRHQCRVKNCYDGKTGISELKSNTYDLILTDVGLPDMEIDELCQAIMAYKSSEAEVIATSAHFNQKTKKLLRDLGVKHTIEKPITQDIIKRIVIGEE